MWRLGMRLKMLKEQNDERYIGYHPIEELRFLGVVVDEKEMYEILIAKDQDLEKIQPVVNMYMEWFNHCEKELTVYFQELLGEELPIRWMKDIEVYTASIVFNSPDDYGATISFSVECVAGDHSIELDFEKEQIVNNRLVG